MVATNKPDSSIVNVTLQEFKYSAELRVKLFMVNKALENDSLMSTIWRRLQIFML
jgi:hypothetical protein